MPVQPGQHLLDPCSGLVLWSVLLQHLTDIIVQRSLMAALYCVQHDCAEFITSGGRLALNNSIKQYCLQVKAIITSVRAPLGDSVSCLIAYLLLLLYDADLPRSRCCKHVNSVTINL